jgi:hypothetical protein
VSQSGTHVLASQGRVLANELHWASQAQEKPSKFFSYKLLIAQHQEKFVPTSNARESISNGSSAKRRVLLSIN